MKKLLSLSLILSLIVPYTVPLSSALAVETPLNEDSTKISLENNQTSINNDQLNFTLSGESSIDDIAGGRRGHFRGGRRGRFRGGHRGRFRGGRRGYFRGVSRNVNRGHFRGRSHKHWRYPIRRHRYRHARRNWRNYRRYPRYYSNRWHYSDKWRGNIRRYRYRNYPRYHYRNYDQYYNHNYRTIINHPFYNWKWNDGRRWYSDDYYWGGGFWGNFLANMVTVGLTSSIIDGNDYNKNSNYVVIKENSPGYRLFNNYGLTQVQCDTSPDLAFIYGPQDSLICALPNETISAGYYDVNIKDLVLRPRN